jgi:hypothetical protein
MREKAGEVVRLKLYIATPGVTLDITPYAAQNAKDAWQAGRLVQEVAEVKDGDGKAWIVTLTPKGEGDEAATTF